MPYKKNQQQQQLYVMWLLLTNQMPVYKDCSGTLGLNLE